VEADHEALGRLYARLIALRRLSHGVAGALDRDEPADVGAALVKDFGTIYEQDAVEELRLLAGPRGARWEQLLEQAQLAAPSFTLRGGTTEVLRGIIGRMLVSG